MASKDYDGLDDQSVRIFRFGPAIVLEMIPVESTGLKRRVYLEPGTPVTIGRASKNGANKVSPSERNAWFECPVISRRHAELVAYDGVVLLKDLGSMHGTYKNGVALEKNVRTTLRDGDKVQLGTDVSRGQEFFRGINLTIKYNASPSPDLASGSRTFEVPTATDDDEDDDDSGSDYGTDSSDIFHQTDFSTSSPQTSPASKHELVEGTPQKPITIEPDREQEVIDLVGVEIGYARDSPEPPELEKTTKDGIDIRRFMQPIADQVYTFDAPPPSIPKRFWVSPAESRIPASKHHPEGPFISRDIPLDNSMIKSALAEVNKNWSKSPDIMAIPNMLAPAVEATPDTANDVVDPFQTVLDEVDTILALHMPPKQADLAGVHKKRKRDTAETEEAEVLSKKSAEEVNKARGEEILSKIKKNHKVLTGPAKNTFFCDFDGEDIVVAHQASADVSRPAKRRRTSAASVAAHIVHETAKYSFGAAVGAVGTFAFLASPLGGRFADWLGTI